MPDYIIETRGLTKVFGTLVALDHVTFGLQSEGITGLIGDNGAGKTTFISLLTGVYPPTEGDILFEGEKVKFGSPADAIKKGIRTVHQILQVVKIRKVYENFFMGKEICKNYLSNFLKIVDTRAEIEETRKCLKAYGYDFDVEKNVEQLSGGETQIFEVVKHMNWDPRVLILDEPTTALSADKSAKVFELIRQLQVPTLVISHNLLQIMEYCDRIAILRKGTLVALKDAKATSLEEISKIMMGYIGS